MSLRSKLMAVFAVSILLVVGAVAWVVSDTTRRSFERLDRERIAALVAQFRGEFSRRGEEIAHRVGGIADAEATLRMAIELARQNPDPALYVNDARGLANTHGLEIVELVNDDGTILSSAHWPARFGYKNAWVNAVADWRSQGAFLRREELADGGAALALLAVRTVGVGEKKLYVIGGRELGQEFLASLVLPAGMRVVLFRNLQPSPAASDFLGARGPVEQSERLAPLVERVRQAVTSEIVDTIAWTSDPASAETFHAIPLTGRGGELLAVLMVGSSRREIVELDRFIQQVAIAVAAAGILIGIVFSGWLASRVTRPLETLALAAGKVAAGRWDTRVDVRARDETGQLAGAFNQMTEQLAEQRERLIQTERVAAWRDLARRLAHELKNPLFPLQLTVENLQRTRQQHPDQFDEVFRESTATLLAEIENLKAIVGRFSDFAKMPAPELADVDVNALLRGVVQLFDAQFSVAGRPPIAPEVYLEENIGAIQADAELLSRALQNLVLNAMDAMPAGGTLTLRTRRLENGVRLEVSDTGAGLTPEECHRLFTPYYTTKQQGTGLGLAIVQSVISDHGGSIGVESEPGRGTTIRIELPDAPPQATRETESTEA